MPALSKTTPDVRRPKSEADTVYLNRVGDRVRAARDARGLTRKALSVASGVSERYLADLEAGAGNASVLVLRRVAQALDTDLEDLLTEQDEPGAGLAAAIALLRRLPPAAVERALRWLEAGVPSAATKPSGRIALVGLRGAGKTTVGRAVAKRLAVPFVELDREIERAAGMELAEIFALQGKAAYRAHELHCLEAVVGQQGRAVIATGGGLVTEPATYELLLETCTVVWLKADPASHMHRVTAQGDLRPMSGNPKAMDDLRAILQSREGLYRRAHLTIDTTGLDADETARRVVDAVEQRALTAG